MMMLSTENRIVMDIYRYIITILLTLLLFSCSRTIELCNCPKPISYSREFQDNLVRDLERINRDNNSSYYINQMVIDLFNLNNELRECHD